jgi:hypothetical protein
LNSNKYNPAEALTTAMFFSFFSSPASDRGDLTGILMQAALRTNY